MSHKVIISADTGEAVQVPLTADEQANIDALRAEADAALPTQAIAAIKAEAARRITTICPDWKQRNLTARAAELAIKGQANWTDEEAAEVAYGQAIWDAIKSIRSKSDQLEQWVSTQLSSNLIGLDVSLDDLWR